MKVKKLLVMSAVIFTCGFFSCQQEDEVFNKEEVSELTLSQIAKMGFNNQNVQRIEGGYLVEGDIFIGDKDLTSAYDQKAVRVGESEQYRTNNLVNVGTSRTIKVAITTSLPSSYVAALDEAIRRYNAENLTIKFQRVSSNYEILFSKAPANSSYLASAGFPSGGNPYNSVKVNSDYLGSNPGTNYLATILAHEAGHCIGFRIEAIAVEVHITMKVLAQ
jgi:hypothetical protein